MKEMAINSVTLVGRLTKDVELRYTGSGLAVASFTMAVDRNFKNAQGERETDFINCVAWRKTAEILANYAHKGAMVGITGRVQTRSYQNNEGNTVYVTEVVSENVQLIETDKSKQENTSSNQKKYNNPNFNDDPFEKNDDSIDISDDDLPF
jgi:single-strand DNA-binding protein